MPKTAESLGKFTQSALVTRDPVLNEPVEMLPPALFMKTFEALKLDTLSATRFDPTRRLLTARFSALKTLA